MRAALYLRVSTMDQVEGFSLDVQRERLIAYCTAQGWDNMMIYMDDGETGSNMERPGLKRLIRHVQEKKIDAVVVLKLDRLSRRQKDVLYLLEEVFEGNGVVFKSATEPFDTSTPLGKAMIGVLAVFAQLERDMIVERTVGGKLQRIRSGKHPGGHAPFGYRWKEDGDELEIVANEADTVQQIFLRFLDGESYSKIARWAQQKHPSHTFDAGAVKRTLQRPTYAKQMLYGGRVYDSNTEPIIDIKIWNKAQIELKKRDDGLPPRGEYLLTGLCRCGLCGTSVVHETKQHKNKKTGTMYYKDYICCKAQKFKPYSCNMGYHQRLDVEKYVVKQLKMIATDPDDFKAINNVDNVESNMELIESLEARVKAAESGLENLMEAIQLGVVKAASVAKRIRDLEEEKEAAESSIDELRDKDPHPQESLDLSFIQEVGNIWDELELEEQKIVLRKLITKIEVPQRGSEPKIIWNFAL